jgi:signal transduction histidine kinase/CheY-like chemotaxis protein
VRLQGLFSRYWIFALFAAATLTVVALGWVVARDFRDSTDEARQLQLRFAEGLQLIDQLLFETAEVRRIMLYALHTTDANRQLEYVDQSRSAEARVRLLLGSPPPILSTERTRLPRESVASAWGEYLEARDEVAGLILEGSLREGVALDEAVGTARFNRVRAAIADLRSAFQADAAAQVEAERTRSSHATTRLGLIVFSALLLVAIGVHLVNRRVSLEAMVRVKTDFLTTISHELRTPLTGVIGITDLLDTGSMPAAQRELVRMLRTNATTLHGLINNVLDYSRIDAGLMALHPRRFALHVPVEEALDSVSEAAARKGLALGYVIESDVPDVIADEDRVRQILLNLLSNAVKFTDAGEIAIHVRAALEESGAAAVTITVRDTGIGIAEAVQQRVFQWFTQVEPAATRRVRGTGLGLAISDRLSRLLGGSMSVESRVGEGSIFRFVFRGAAAPAREEADAAAPRGLRVMLIHPPGIVRDQLVSLLHRWDASVFVHAGGAPPERADVVIVDGDPSSGAARASLLRNRGAWGLDRVPVVTVARMGAAGAIAAAPQEEIITTPVRMEALRCALGVAAGRARADGAARAPDLSRFDRAAVAVLVVEDNDPNRRVIRLMLNELGLDCHEAATGHDAIDAALKKRYDVILMDLHLPDIDGVKATRQIRRCRNGQHATIVALTANVVEGDEARCRAAGMDAYLQKPLKLAALGDALARFVN